MLATIGTSSTSLSVWAGNGGGVSAVIGSSFESSEDSPTCLENASKSAAGAAGASFVTVSAIRTGFAYFRCTCWQWHNLNPDLKMNNLF